MGVQKNITATGGSNMTKQKIYTASITIALVFFMTACHKQQTSVKPTVRVVQPVQTIVIERFEPTAADDYKAMEFASAACALKHTYEGDVNLSTVREVMSIVDGNTSGRLVR